MMPLQGRLYYSCSMVFCMRWDCRVRLFVNFLFLTRIVGYPCIPGKFNDIKLGIFSYHTENF
jgi:hypothetical protein